MRAPAAGRRHPLPLSGEEAPQALRDRLPRAFRAKFPRDVPAKAGRNSNTGSAGQSPPKPNSASKAALDWSVLETILVDLITWTDGPFEGRENANPTIFFSTARPNKWVSAGGFIDDLQLRLDRAFTAAKGPTCCGGETANGSFSFAISATLSESAQSFERLPDARLLIGWLS